MVSKVLKSSCIISSQLDIGSRFSSRSDVIFKTIGFRITVKYDNIKI